MGSSTPPDSAHLSRLMETMGRPQLVKLAAFTLALSHVREAQKGTTRAPTLSVRMPRDRSPRQSG